MSDKGIDTTNFEQSPRLVSTNGVAGTPVLSRDGDRIGAVAAFLVDPFSGRASYIVVAAGGVLGMGQSYHPIPWDLLRFDPARGGYVVSIDKTVLDGGPSFKTASEPTFDRAYTDRVLSYFGSTVPPPITPTPV